MYAVVNASGLSAESESKAIILPDTRLLLPVLHHMQDKNLNISMGYPLENTALNRLLENVLTLQENKSRQKFQEIRAGYYWKDCIRLIRHPYIKMLNLITQDMQSMENDHTAARDLWRDYLYKLEKELRRGRRFADLGALMREVALGLQEHRYRDQLLSFVGRLEEILLKSWENLDTIGDMAKALTQLCTLLTEQGEELWRKFPLDAECLYRFMQSLVPELNFSALRDKQLEPKLLFTILRSLIREERVAFEADPLTATQILGLLESRLLSFRQVFIVEATDDLLPGGSQSDPLLPDSLRLELGLPDMFRKQQMTAYYFYRLLAGAEQIHLFWEEGLEQKGLQDAKKLKSRFVEELLWQEEQKKGRLLKPDKHAQNIETASESPVSASVEHICAISDGPLHLLTSDSGAFNPADRSVRVTEPIRNLLNLRTLNNGRGLSAGKLNSFLTCPLSFYYKEVAGFKPVEEVTEDDDPLETGKLLHEVLAAYYTPKLGRIFTKNEQSRRELLNCFEDIFQKSSIADSFPADARLWLRERIPFQLRKYLDQQPEQTRVVALEVEANARISHADGTEFKLTGILDRMDERIISDAAAQETEAKVNCNELVILDYKSGKINPPQADFWTDSILWSNVQAALKMPEENRPELLAEIAERLNSNIQLPVYLFLLRHGQLRKQHDHICKDFEQGKKLCNAAWVDLRDEGKERLLLQELSQEEMTEILDKKIPDLLTFILLSIKNSQSFTVRRGAHCGYCPYAALCRIG
jgi:CRISPR/Cas system-associated exonuclease Cas4 (RecB family)